MQYKFLICNIIVVVCICVCIYIYIYINKKVLNEKKKKKDSKMQSVSCMSATCEPNNFLIASCESGNLRVVNYSSTRPGPHCRCLYENFPKFSEHIFYVTPLDDCF